MLTFIFGAGASNDALTKDSIGVALPPPLAKDLFNAVGGYASLALMEDIELSAALARYRRPHCLRLTLGTSSRRWRSRGIARTIVSMWALRLAWFCGISASRLARWYGYR